jgi:hypothetical protein
MVGPIRRSNRPPKPKIYWEPPITTPYKRQLQPCITMPLGMPPPMPPGMPLPMPPGTPLPMPQFTPINRPGRPQNLPHSLEPLQLFQLFFPVKDIEVIVKETNQKASKIELVGWQPLTIIEAYHYLGCLIYIGI